MEEILEEQFCSTRKKCVSNICRCSEPFRIALETTSALSMDEREVYSS